MKTMIIAPLLFWLFLAHHVFGQGKTLDIPGMHQLINQSIDENKVQLQARNQQAVNTANEQANLTLLQKTKNMYRTLQERYNTLGTAINIADIGIYATPMVNRIISNQAQVISLAQQNPALIALGYQTEIEFAEKAESLLGYVTGLSLSLGDVNQMKASDRKILFDYVISELSTIQQLSGTLVNNLQNVTLSGMIRGANPFADFISQDKAMADRIIQNAKYLKK